MSDHSPILYLIFTVLCTIAIIVTHQVPKPVGLYKKRHRLKLKFSSKLFSEPVKYCKDCGNIWHGQMHDTECVPNTKRCRVVIYTELTGGRTHKFICSDHYHWTTNLNDCGKELIDWKELIKPKLLVRPTLHVM